MVYPRRSAMLYCLFLFLFFFFLRIAEVSAAYESVAEQSAARFFNDEAVPLPLQRVTHRRLAQDRRVPTASPTATPSSAAPTLLPPSLEPTLLTTTSTDAPLATPNGSRAPTPAPSLSPSRSPPPPLGNETLLLLPMVNLSNLDVLVTAIITGSTEEERENQLYLYRKEIRLVLESYLNQTMRLTDLHAVELHAIVSRPTRRRFLQSSESVQQLYSYAGAAIFRNTTTALPDANVVHMEQALALSDTPAIQADLDLSLQQVVTIQAITVWTDDDNNSTNDDDDRNGTDDDALSNKNDNTAILVVTIAAGMAFLAFCLGGLVLRRVRKRAAAPPPLVTTTQTRRGVPFSPYGHEDGEDAHSIVEDLEKLEDLRNSSGPSSPPLVLSEPYLQLDLCGTATASDGTDSPEGIHTPPSHKNSLPQSLTEPPMKEDGAIYYPKEEDSPGDEWMARRQATAAASTHAPVERSALYSAPVAEGGIPAAGSHDSMDGFSLTSGFYGGPKPITLRNTTAPEAPKPMRVPTTTTAPQPASPKTSPSWMIASPKETSDAYSSDSETNFSYTHIGIAPRVPSGALGPTLASMSMDSSDQVSFELEEEDSMLHLNNQVGIGIIADSPTFTDPRGTQHVYPDEDTPVITNGRHSLSHSTHMPAVPYGRHDLRNTGVDDDEDDSPLRTSALASRGALNRSLASAAAVGNTTTSAHIGDTDSQPSDELMNDDSMAQDLQGFTEELDRIQQDIGWSKQRSDALPITGHRILTHAPRDEFGSGRRTGIVTPDDEVKQTSNYNVRRR